MATEHKFRYLIPPGTDFKFVAKMRAWLTVSLILLVASIAILFVNKQVRGDYMNWTIDFKGGTEIVFSFTDPEDPATSVPVDPARVRAALQAIGDGGVDVSEFRFQRDGREVVGLTVRTRRFGAVTPEEATRALEEIHTRFADRGIEKASFSGDRVLLRTRQLVPEDEMAEVLAAAGLEMKPVEAGQAQINATPNEDTGEYNATFTVHGLARHYEQTLEQAIGGIDAKVEQAHGVGAKAGAKLRNDGIRAIFYSMLLIVLYLAFRFDIRYAPGAIFATFHDAIMVIGVFAVTWTEVSLTTVAALLTVIGYSVNDTVVVFDRIRENMHKLKDKKIERIIDISLNEVLNRSILTSLTLFVVTLAMNVLGTGLVKNFAFAMNIGVIVGVYSSIFLAAPLFLWIHKRYYSGPVKKTRRALAPSSES